MSDEHNEKSALVPRLRFPEFREGGEWAHAPLGHLFSERQEVGFTNLPLLSLMDKEGIVPQEETNRKNNSSADKSKYLRVVPGDIAYNTMRMWEGRSAYVGIEGLISPAYTVCVPAERINSIFVSYQFKTEALIRQFRRYSQGLVKDTLNLKFEAFSRIEFAYPAEKREQQQIADCLSSLDELIAAEANKLDALKTHKKGLMQQLFPAEGETLPRLRFPEFREAGEWVACFLADVCEINPSKIRGRDEELVSFVPMAAVSEEGRIENPEIRAYAGVKKGYTSFGENDVIVAKITPCFENGKAALAKDLTNGIAFGSTEFHVFRAKKTCLAEFLFFQIYRDEVRAAGARNMIGNAGQRRVPVSFFETLPFYLPTIAEQQKIADCLSSLDDLIAAQAQKIELLKHHKKGLMQQLFPVLDEAPA